MKKSTIASLLTFFLVMVLGVGYIALGVIHYKPFEKYKTVTMQLDNVAQLLPGSSVLLRGVKMGEVREIERVNDKVRVKLRYEGQYDIPQNTAIQIEQLSAVGEPYVDFRPQSFTGPFLSDDATVETKQIKQPLAVPETFKLIAGLSSSINSADLGGITETLAQATSNTQAALPNLEQAGNILAQTINARMPNIRQMLENTQKYQADMDWLPGSLGEFGGPTNTFLSKDVQVLQALDVLMKGSNSPDALTKTINPYLIKIAPDVSKLLSNLGVINEPLVPVVQALTDTLPQIDMSALLSQALNTVGSDGAANLTVVIPPKK